MDNRNPRWPARDRQLFITTLTESGNPATAAAAIGQSLAAAYRMRDRWPALAEEWRRALGIAWEQVEMRVLANLLDGEAADVDPRMALAMLRRRTPVLPPLRPMVTIDAARIAKVRNEIRALAAPSD